MVREEAQSQRVCDVCNVVALSRIEIHRHTYN